MRQDEFKIGVITSPHGVRGEMKVFPTTEDPDRFLDLDRVIVDRQGRREEREVRGVRFSKNMVLLRLDGVESMNEAEAYRRCELFVSRENAIPLEKDEYYMGDLIGLSVELEDGEVLGTLKDVMQTGANDVYLVDTDRYGEVLLPAIRDCILSVDVEGGRMTVHLLPGLAD